MLRLFQTLKYRQREEERRAMTAKTLDNSAILRASIAVLLIRSLTTSRSRFLSWLGRLYPYRATGGSSKL
jgi:hypothetical protein